MSKDQQTDNAIQQNAVNTLHDNYDSDAINVLHQAQREVNKRLSETRQDDNRSYLEIEAEARLLLQRAHEEGEVHIVERHRKTPMIFFFSKGVLMRWSDGEIVTVGEIHGIDSEQHDVLFRISSHQFETSVNDPLISLITPRKVDKEVGFYIWSVAEPRKNVFSIKKVLSSLNYTSEEPVIDLIFSDSGIHGFALPHVIQTSQEARQISTPNASNMAPPFRPLVIFAEAIDTFFTIDSNQIKRIKRVKESTPEVVLGAGQTGTPIALAYHTSHESLLIQDAGKREIGLHFPNAGAERIWRSFNNDSFIGLPEGVFRSDDQFTMSCLLKRNQSIPLSADPPTAAQPFKLWVDKDDDLLKLQYNVNGVAQTQTATTKFTQTAGSGWFLFTLQKQQNMLTVFMDGLEYCTFQALDFPSLKTMVAWVMPGYFVCELRVWETIRTPEQLKRFSRMWLPHSEFSGLTGYWHLFVTGKFNTGLSYEKVSRDGQTTELHQEPDLSRNHHHLRTFTGENGEPDDLNITTVISYTASSPFATVIPLYEQKMLRQGIELDDNTGKIYWIDETIDGRINMMVGSVLGHTPPTALFEIDTESRFHIISQISSPYQNLMIAHANRRDAMERQFLDISNAHLQNHIETQARHSELDEKLTVALARIDNRQAYAQVHDLWLNEMNRIRSEEENAERLASEKRRKAIANAKEMTDIAHRQVIAHRRKR